MPRPHSKWPCPVDSCLDGVWGDFDGDFEVIFKGDFEGYFIGEFDATFQLSGLMLV